MRYKRAGGIVERKDESMTESAMLDDLLQAAQWAMKGGESAACEAYIRAYVMLKDMQNRHSFGVRVPPGLESGAALREGQ